jgi:hypothetical protein
MVFAALGLGLFATHAQATEGFRIAGTVVSSTTGEPVRDATVSVTAVGTAGTSESAVSDNDGHFVLERLAAAKYQLRAAKRGFLTAFYDEHEGSFNTAIVTGEGQDTTELVFRLTPEAVLRGVVTDDGGDPVFNAQVLLSRRVREHGQSLATPHADMATTDDTGAYEFTNLAPGEYLLAVKAEPWYATHRSASSSPARVRSQGETALDVAYPVTYFDSTTDEAAATPIVLGGGSREEANVSLHAMQALHVSADVPPAPSVVSRPLHLRQIVFGATVGVVIPTIQRPQGGMQEFLGIAPGHYELTQGDPPRIAELDLNSSQDVDPELGTPTVTVSGTVAAVAGTAMTGDFFVSLEPLENPAGGISNQAIMVPGAQQGSFRILAVPPGRWALHFSEAGAEMPVLSISIGDKVHAGSEFTVRDQPLNLVARVSAKTTSIEGFAKKDGKGLAGAMVVLVPKDKALLPERVRRDQSDSDGSFVLANVAPGDYTVVAIENGWELDWTRPEVMARYLSGGVAVPVTDSSGNVLSLSQPVPVEQR